MKISENHQPGISMIIRHPRTTFKGENHISCHVSNFGFYLDHLACCPSVWRPHHQFLRITETGTDPLWCYPNLPHWYAEYAGAARWGASKTAEWRSTGWGLQKLPERVPGRSQKLPLGEIPYTLGYSCGSRKHKWQPSICCTFILNNYV